MSDRRRGLAALLGAALLLITAPTPAGSAAAPPDRGRVERSTAVTKDVYVWNSLWSKQFKMCVVYSLATTLSATRKSRGTPRAEPRHYLADPKVSNTTIKLSFTTSCSGPAGPKKHHQANNLSYRAMLYGYSCSFNPSFTAGLPWAVGVSITPDCGDERTAWEGESYMGGGYDMRRGYRFSVTNQGISQHWSQSTAAVGPGHTSTLCASAAFYVVLRDTIPQAKTVKIKAPLSDICVSTK